MCKKTSNLISRILDDAEELNKKELEEFMIKLNILSLAVMRGLKGNEFARSILVAAIKDKNPIAAKPPL